MPSYQNIILRLFFSALLVLLPTISVADAAEDDSLVTITSPTGAYHEFPLGLYEDISANLSLDEVRRSASFSPTSNNISSGYSKSAIWLRFKIKNSLGIPVTYVLKSIESIVHHLDFYSISADGSIDHQQKGVGYTTADGLVDAKHLEFSITLAAGESKAIYIRMYSLLPNVTSFRLLDPASVNEFITNRDILMALFFGAGMALAIYNLFLYLYGRDISYLLYVMYLLPFLLWQLTLNAFPPFETFSSTETRYYTGAYAPFCMAFLNFFTRKLLDIRVDFPVIDKVIYISGWFYLALTPFTLFDVQSGFFILSSLSPFTLFFLLYVGIISHFSGNRTAKFFVIAQFPFLIFTILLALMSSGYLEYNAVNRHGIMLGSMLEILLFSLALGFKINLLKEDKLNVLRTAQAELELKVAERTGELDEANQLLKKQNITDSLTGVINRLGIEQRLETEYKRYVRYHECFGIIIIDIDYFKQINDKHGHLAGDEFLVEFSSLLTRNVRESDVVSRWGGEEFIVVCLEIDLEQATHIAEKLRQAVESFEFSVVGNRTASFGVSVIQPEDSVGSLIKRADNALYAAKNSGRNKVVGY